MPDLPAGSPPLPNRDAGELASQLAAAEQLHLTLPGGLRAAAEETRRPLVAKSLRELAESVEQGATLGQAVEQLRHGLPPALRGALAAAARSPELCEVLFDVLEYQREQRWTQRGIYVALAYPCGVLLLSVFIFCFAQLAVVHPFAKVSEEYELQLSPLSLGLLWWSGTGAFALLALTCLVVSLVISARLLSSRERWHRVLGAAPLAGEIWRCLGHSEATRLLGMLVRRQIPLPEAILLTSDCCGNADAAALWRMTARDVARGASLEEALLRQQRIPAVVWSYARWGQRSGSLADSLQASSELLGEQAQHRGDQLREMIPSAMFFLIAFVIFATVTSIFIPIIGLFSSF